MTAIRHRWCSLTALALLLLSAQAQEEPGWQQRSFEAIEYYAAKPPGEAIPGLGLIATRAWNEYTIDNNSWARKPDYKAIYFAAQSKLLAIPGHAEWHRDEIERLRAKVDPQYPSTNFVFQQRRMEHIKDMGHLPSPETVRVLGEMLDDPRDDSPAFKPDDTPPLWWATRHCAAASLLRLGIVGAPVKRGSPLTDEERTELWRAWYAQVKAGTRTFRFEGSDVEHRLAPPPDGRRPSKDPGPSPSPKANPPPAQAATVATPAEAIPRWPWIAGIAALTAASLWWLKRRKPAPPTRQGPPPGRNP